jgi:putative ABC transport system permease protein
MFRNYLIIGLRSLRRHAGFAAINIVGLSVSMAVGLVLILFLRQSAAQDDFHEKADRLVRVYSDFKSSFNRDHALYGTSPANLSELLLEEVPGIEQTAKIRSGFGGTLVVAGVGLPLRGLYADAAFFDLFSFELGSGDPATALNNPGSIVLSPSEARRFFGSRDPMGQVMQVAGDREYTVTGILARDDYHTIFPLGALASYSSLESDPETREMLGLWTSSIYRSYTFALLAQGASLGDVQRRVSDLIPVHFEERDSNRLVSLTVQRMRDINLGALMGNEIGSTLPAGVAWILGSLALMILLTACFNYVGLTVSRAMKRSREVGVRKVFGATRSNIKTQFIFEAVVVSSVSVLVAVVILQWLVPRFNEMSFVSQTGMNLAVGYFSDYSLYGVFAAFTLAVALIAGLYPAVYLSRFQPAHAVKGATDSSGKGGSVLRRSLVVVQFSFSVIFLILTLTMARQASHMQQADYGFAQEDIVNVRLFDVPYRRFRDQMVARSSVASVSGISLIPAMGSRSDVWVRNEAAPEDDRAKAYQFSIDENLIENLELELLAGANLLPEVEFDDSGKALVNETLVQALNLGKPLDAIGTSFVMGDSTRVEIAGVLKDFRTDPLTEGISPNVFAYRADQLAWANVRFVPGRMEQGIQDIESVWSGIGHARGLDYGVFAAQLRDNFTNLLVRDMYRLIGFIAFLTVIIACLGLLGIASFNVQRRTREISIRKVLGADVSGLIGLLSREFLVLIAVSAAISLPIAWALSTMWLQSFEYRVELGPGTAALGLLAMLVITLGTIGSQTLKAAVANPIDHLHED